MVNAKLAACRAEIDAIDVRLVSLLKERMDVVNRVIAIKRQQGVPALLPDRVEEVLSHVRQQAGNCGAPAELADEIYRALIAWTIRYEERALGEDER